MRGARCALVLAVFLVVSVGASSATADEVRGGIQVDDEARAPVDVDARASDKRAIVAAEVSTSDALLRAAHRTALEKGRERATYREALVYQRAARAALEDDELVAAMNLTLRAQSTGRDVIYANTAGEVVEARAEGEPALVSAGGVSVEEVEPYLEKADEAVLSLDLLFVEGDDDRY